MKLQTVHGWKAHLAKANRYRHPNEPYKSKVKINDLVFIRGGSTPGWNSVAPLLHSLMASDISGYGHGTYTCHHGMMDPFNPEFKEVFEAAERTQPDIKKRYLENATSYYSTLFSMLSSGARIDTKNSRGLNALQSCCCYDTAGFLLAYAALYPDEYQAVIPIAFSDTQNRIFDCPIEKQRLLNSVEQWIPIVLESSRKNNVNRKSEYVSSAAQAPQIFEKFKTLIPNLDQPDLQIKLTDHYSDKYRMIDRKDWKVKHSHYCGEMHLGI